MTFEEILTQVHELLERQGRVSYRALKRRFELSRRLPRRREGRAHPRAARGRRRGRQGPDLDGRGGHSTGFRGQSQARPAFVHAHPSRREDPQLTPGGRGRAQASHGAVRGSEGVDGAAGRPRSGGGAASARSRPGTDDGGRPPLRGHGEPGAGRRDHGALRRAAGARGPCDARLLCGRCPCRTPSAGMPRSCGASRDWTCRSASGSTRARSWSAPSAAISTWTTRRWARRRIWPRAWSSSRARGRR